MSRLWPVIAAAFVAALPLSAAAEPAPPDAGLAALDQETARRRAELAELREDANDKDYVREALSRMAALDALVRQSWLRMRARSAALSAVELRALDAEYDERIAAVDRANTARLKRLLELRDWITIGEFGAAAEEQAWLIAQHADHDPSFQREALQRLARRRADGSAAPAHYANLFDRVAVRSGRHQRFGTQGGCLDGRWQPDPVEDPAAVDARRAEAGLEPLAAYSESQSGACVARR